MSEHQFAQAVGVSRGAAQQWGKPGGTAPKRSNQPQVAKLLGISVAELIVSDGGELYLNPLNARYPIKPLGTATIIGVVREFTKRFR